MRRLLYSVLLITSTLFSSSKFNELNSEQLKKIAKTVTDVNIDQNDRTLIAAIGWQESDFDKKIAFKKTSWSGYFQLSPKSVKRRNPHISMTDISYRLRYDWSFMTKESQAEINYWRDYFKKKNNNSLIPVLAAYNNGFAWKRPKSMKYANEVISKKNYLDSLVRQGLFN